MGLFNRTRTPREHAAPVAATGTYDAAPRAGDLTMGDYANGIPNMKLGAMIRSLFKQILWVGPLFVIGALIAWPLTSDFKRTYTGEGTVMVQIGDEYVYQPVVGSVGQSTLTQTPDTITLNEIAIIKSPEVMDAVLGTIVCDGAMLSRFSPDTAQKLGDRACSDTFRQSASLSYQNAYMELRKQMDKEFYVAARPKSSIIDLSYKHEDPQLAVSTLNALMDEYMEFRRNVFIDGASDAAAERRAQTEEQLSAVDRQISAFLSRNGISDFDSAQKGASKRTEDLKAALNTERARIAETERALAVVEDQLRTVPETINLYVDDRASNRIAQAELELKQLLAKYLPGSDPVRQKQLEIAEMRELQRANNGQATGGRRVGPNPVYQELLTRRNTLAATANSLREKEFTLQRQLDSVDGKLARLTKLSPQFNDLLRERETLTTRLASYLSKEQEALLNQEQAMSAAENVKVISNATYPVKGRDMHKVMWAMASLAWGFVLFMLALFRVFADPRLYATPPGARTALREQTMQPTHAEPIPEPVMPYRPAEPLPAEYAPAAAAGWQAQEWSPGAEPAYAADPHAAYADGYDPYAQPAHDAAAYEAAGYGAPAADGTLPVAAPEYDNPYLQGASAAPLAPPHY